MLILYSLLLLSFVFLSSGAHRDLPVLTHSFPTRRSSELAAFQHAGALVQFVAKLVRQARRGNRATDRPAETIPCPRGQRRERCRAEARSEEHTSAIQSLMRNSYAVFCLKKKIHSTPQQLYTRIQSIQVVHIEYNPN